MIPTNIVSELSTIGKKGDPKDNHPSFSRVADDSPPLIVTFETDPYRDAAIQKRIEEEANPETVDWAARMPYRSHDDFGGPWGVAFLVVFSHLLIWYWVLCLQVNHGDTLVPTNFQDLVSGTFFGRMFTLGYMFCAPTVKSCAWYWTFLAIQAIFALTLPGMKCLGQPLPSLKGGRLTYHCNAICTFWVTFGSFALAHYTEIFDYTQIVDNLGPLATTTMFTMDIFAVCIYLNIFGTGEKDPGISGNIFYDIVMGAVLNPRLGNLDIKMWFEIRVSWIMMTMITTSAALKFYLIHGYLSNNMVLITVGITIYSYSVMKGENLVLPTWDITTELYGLFLAFWNANLPYFYSAQAIYILKRDPDEIAIAIADPVFYIMLAILLVAYYCFDTTNSQKNTFRQMYIGSFVPRPWAIPSFSYGTLDNPRYLLTKAGTPLLIDGWYAMARKWHYTSDATMGLIWCLSAGFNTALVSKFYYIFFVSMLIHREIRDSGRCARKYGKDWKTYCQLVPWVFIPYIY